jgi:hypothetical protein
MQNTIKVGETSIVGDYEKRKKAGHKTALCSMQRSSDDNESVEFVSHAGYDAAVISNHLNPSSVHRPGAKTGLAVSNMTGGAFYNTKNSSSL